LSLAREVDRRNAKQENVMIRITADGADIVGRPASLAVALLAIALAPFPPSAAHAACKEWKLNEFTIKQTNGFFVWGFPRSLGGGRFEGGIRYYPAKEDEPDKPDGLSAVEGKMEGSVSGDDVSFTVHWNNGALAEYTGQISEAGFVDGKTVDKLNPGSTAGWSQVPWGGGKLEPAAACMDVAAPAAPPPDTRPVRKLGKRLPGTSTTSTLPQPAMATVIADVDVYKLPGGQPKDKIGILYSNNKTTKVSLVAPCDENNWCHVKGAPVPTGEGFVYSGTPPDFQSLQF
jgi:hypothetical protein